MKIHLEPVKANDSFHGKNSGFVDSGFVKTSDELVIKQADYLLLYEQNWLKRGTEALVLKKTAESSK